MSDIFLFSNNAASTLAGPISNTDLELTLASGQGALFPNPSAGQQFAITLTDASTGVVTEIVYCDERVGDVCTIIRAQEGTTAQNWLAGDLAVNQLTKGQMEAMQQTAALFPARIITLSGAFDIFTTDAFGGVGLYRTAAPAASTGQLPLGAVAGQLYAVEDLAKNFFQYNVRVDAPAGQTILGADHAILNINGQCGYFRYYGSNLWSFKP